MRNKDTGEFELVVGDKELLSGFFIGVVLLAVVFAMGYVLGRGTPKSASVAPESATVSANSAVDTRPQAASPAVPPSPEPAAATPSTPLADTSQPAATPPVEAPPQPTTMPAKEPSAPAPTPPKAQPVADPANGNYWQVLAGSAASADAYFQTLKGRGFPVTKRPGPNNLTLVWVGPYTDKESLTRAKKQLEDAGITNLYRKP
jgi:cell division septation protein DedD